METQSLSDESGSGCTHMYSLLMEILHLFLMKEMEYLKIIVCDSQQIFTQVC